ncbi:MAG: hypothetical protein NVSMB9_02810 [Isosphaeraceae bacterium]
MSKKYQLQPAVQGLEERLVLSHPAAVPHTGVPAYFASRNQASARFDINFLEGMIPHHQMAIRMSRIALRNSDNPEIRGLAQRIIQEQRPEIAEMRTLLSSWYGIRGFRSGMAHGDRPMLQELRSLRGSAFNQAFLTDMLDHHERAINGDGTMMIGARDVLAHEGVRPRLLKLAGNIVRTQTAEILEMKTLLGPGAGTSAGARPMPHMHG